LRIVRISNCIKATLVAFSLLTSGCIEVNGSVDFQPNGSAKVTGELGLGVQLVAMIAASKDGKNPLEDCGKDMGDAQPGIKVIKAEKGVRGNGNTAMVTCSIQVEIDDVLKKFEEARTEAPVIGDGAKVKPGSYVKLTKLNDTTYRFAADFALPEDKEVKDNPFIPMMLAQSSFSLSMSGVRVENVKGRRSQRRRQAGHVEGAVASSLPRQSTGDGRRYRH
jgi:hypothetical protein